MVKRGNSDLQKEEDERREKVLGELGLRVVPQGDNIRFGNAGEVPVRLLIIHVPAADDYFVELQELWSKTEPPTPEEERALMRRHGLMPVE